VAVTTLHIRAYGPSWDGEVCPESAAISDLTGGGIGVAFKRWAPLPLGMGDALLPDLRRRQ